MGALVSALAPAFGNLVDKLVNDFHMSPEDRAKVEQAAADAQAKAVQAAQDYEVQLNAIASNNIQAEAKSGNKLADSARPLFLYLMYFVLIFNYVVLPLVQYFGGKPLAPINLPAELWFMFSTGYLGYVTMRSFDKQQSLPGQSNITLPFGITATNTSK